MIGGDFCQKVNAGSTTEEDEIEIRCISVIYIHGVLLCQCSNVGVTDVITAAHQRAGKNSVAYLLPTGMLKQVSDLLAPSVNSSTP